jgi:hypothetical protein
VILPYGPLAVTVDPFREQSPPARKPFARDRTWVVHMQSEAYCTDGTSDPAVKV